jgi:hypothetical protein
MAYRQLFLFVEGDDDERFLKTVAVPLLERVYDHVRFVKFSAQKRSKIAAYLQSVKVIPSADYLLIRDLDRAPCVSAAKAEVQRVWPQLGWERVQIVKAEIESWYCAGIAPKDPDFGTLSIATCASTEGVTKEAYNAALGQQGTSRLPLLIAMLERFDLETARRRNDSLRYFVERFLEK